jgi:hypothetical protein
MAPYRLGRLRPAWKDRAARLSHLLFPLRRTRVERLNSIIEPLRPTREQVRRYCEFVDRLRRSYGSTIDFDTHVEIEFSHFLENGRVVVNMYAKTFRGEAMIGVLKEKLG